MRDSVKNFSTEMEYILSNNDDKGGWRYRPRKNLLDFLKLEIEELEESLINGHEELIQKECVDVANFVHMIWDNIDFAQKSRSE